MPDGTNGNGGGSRSVSNYELKNLQLELQGLLERHMLQTKNSLDSITSRLDAAREWQAEHRSRMDDLTKRMDEMAASRHQMANQLQILDLRTARIQGDEYGEIVRLLPNLRQISEMGGSITRASGVVDAIDKRLQRVEADTNRVLEDLRKAALPSQEEWDKADELLKAVAAERDDRREYRGVWRNNAVAAICLTIGGPTVFLLLQHFFK